MKSGSQTRLIAILLAIFTLAAMGLAIANFMQEQTSDPATDGVRWTETTGGLRAYVVPPDSPAFQAGVRRGDVLTAINSVPTPTLSALQRGIDRSGIYSNASYSLERNTHSSGKLIQVPLLVVVDLQPTDRTDSQIERLIALVYLAIGLYVLLRRWTAPKSTHFYVFCLVSFILYAFKYTAVFDGLDLTILTGSIIAFELQPALFLHFAVSFTEEPGRRRRFLYPLLYVPGIVLGVLRYLSYVLWSSTARLQHRLDQFDYAYLATFYLVAAIVFWVSYRNEQQPLQRQQLKWLSRGTVLTVLPFTALYVVPFLLNAYMPSALTRVALLSLILLPLTFSWAIVRYRLMDVDLIFKRGVAYALASAALVGIYFGVIALIAEVIHTRLHNIGEWGLVAAVIVTGLVFDPLKRIIQNRVDRLFDQKSIDYRETLVEFGSELNAQTDLRTLMNSIVERLPQTMLVTRVAVFLAQEESGEVAAHAGRKSRFSLAASHGLSQQVLSNADSLELGFLDFDRRDSSSHLFFETPHSVLRLPENERSTAAALDLNYYVPCRAARHEGTGRSTIAVLGLGRTGDGDFLSSEDMELLESLAGYIGIAIQNAQLYRRLEQKMLDFERLRDFNENIVESINIGVFAVDLEDRVESWNAQMEVMYATPRADALGHHLSEVFPAEFLLEFDRLRGEHGVCTLYKFRLPTPTGESRTANITVAPLLNRDFQAVGRIIIVDDITDRINMETQLTQAEKLSSIGLLAAGIAHEVNTPLAVISSYSQMLNKQLGKQFASDASTLSRLQPVLEKIIQQTFRASEIANGLLNFSRMGSVDFGRVDINAMVSDTVLLLEHQMRSAGVAVIADLAEALPDVSGNRGKLQQVLVNLVLNAKDALQEKGSGSVRIFTSRTLKGVEIRVEDDGVGMSQEVLRKIYDPFFTTKSNPREGHRKGTGLGLAVTYGIVQEHAGTIEVTSTAGEGTTFRLELPSADATPDRTNRIEGTALTSDLPQLERVT